MSHNLNHTKDAVVIYIDAVLETVYASNTATLWFDGSVLQFKNEFIAEAIPVFEAKLQIRLKWNFLATSHGKGLVDGLKSY